jgi:NADPH:quinone reductase-like Zn-dependent oxidoreductase
MRAAQYHKTGPADVLAVEHVDTPEPGPGEVLLKVRACALNRLDVFLRSGATSMPGWTLPHIGGFDIAGEVVEVGPEVFDVEPGFEAMVKARVTGPTAMGRLDIVGIARPGGFAEFVVLPEECLAPKPEAYSWEQAAAFPCCHLTAYYGLILHAGLTVGETVLVHGAGGGAGTAACQVAKAAGARVIATVGSDDKADKARELLGVDLAINYTTDDFVKKTLEFTDGAGADLVFDPVWGKTADKTVGALGYNARWVLLGMVAGATAEITAAKIMFKEISIHGIVEFFADDSQVEQAFSLAYQDRMRPIVSKVWPLARIADAHRQMESSDVFGKIVVTPV